MRAAMLLFAALCIGLGVAPGPLYAMLPFKVDFVPYTGSHVVFQLQLLLFSGLAFFLMLGWLQRTLTITLDVDWLYRRLGVVVLRQFDLWVQASWNGFAGAAARSARIDRRLDVPASWCGRHHGAYLADRTHGILDHHRAGRISRPVLPVTHGDDDLRRRSTRLGVVVQVSRPFALRDNGSLPIRVTPRLYQDRHWRSRSSRCACFSGIRVSGSI